MAATKAQHNYTYKVLPELLREIREKAGLTQRQLGTRLSKPQSYIYNCETANRRVDITEFILWTKGCEVDPIKGFKLLLQAMDK